MPVKINGFQLPNYLVIPIVGAIFWLGGLTYTVADTKDELKKHAEEDSHVQTGRTLERIETKQEVFREDISEIKAVQSAQLEVLNKILRKVEAEGGD